MQKLADLVIVRPWRPQRRWIYPYSILLMTENSESSIFSVEGRVASASHSPPGQFSARSWRGWQAATSRPNVRTIADDIGVSTRTVTRALNELEGLGLIEVERSYGWAGIGTHRKNIYNIRHLLGHLQSRFELVEASKINPTVEESAPALESSPEPEPESGLGELPLPF